MNATQIAYALAKATYDTAFAAYVAEVEAANLDYDADFDAAHDASEVIHAKHGIDSLRRNLRDAEEAMVEWSVAQSLPLAKTAAQRAEVASLPARARRIPSAWEKMVGLAFRLSA